MSTVPPPSAFGEHFATDVIRREKQKILLLRETVTSFTWTTMVKNEQAATLEAGLRFLFAQARPPNTTRPAVCRTDNATAFQSLADRGALRTIGITLELGNQENKNSNPVAERAIKDMHYYIVAVQPAGGKLTDAVLAHATSLMNSKIRWSNMSAYELWTGRDMITGEALQFDQKDIIEHQHQRRLKSHPNVPRISTTFKPGDIVFCNDERSKTRARDKLIVREYMGKGIYRLDRLTRTGRTTRAYLSARGLYKPTTLPPPVLEAGGTPTDSSDTDGVEQESNDAVPADHRGPPDSSTPPAQDASTTEGPVTTEGHREPSASVKPQVQDTSARELPTTEATADNKRQATGRTERLRTPSVPTRDKPLPLHRKDRRPTPVAPGYANQHRPIYLPSHSGFLFQKITAHPMSARI